MRRGLPLLLASLSWLPIAACGNDFEPPDRRARVDRAQTRYSASLFDSIRWATEDSRLLYGNTVYAERCARCHGPMGSGDTEYARGRGLTVPSLIVSDGALVDLDSLRRAIYTGHSEGMPVFSEGGIGLRGIDAAAAYILLDLRPEVGGRE